MEHGLEFKYSKEGNALKRLKESKWIAPQTNVFTLSVIQRGNVKLYTGQLH